MLAIIGGSGLTRLAVLEVHKRESTITPYGAPSSPLMVGAIGGREVVFLARHGERHTIAPHAVNYRANIWALHALGVRDVLSVAAVGGIRGDLDPGTLAIPDQIIDYTHDREHTFFGGEEGGVTHIDFTRPYCESLRRRIVAAAVAAGEHVAEGGTYGVTQGPRLETAAEIGRLERDGVDMVGMTAMPEAALAREKGLCYAAIAMICNHAAGRGGSAQEISMLAMNNILNEAVQRVHRIIDRLVAHDGD